MAKIPRSLITTFDVVGNASRIVWQVSATTSTCGSRLAPGEQVASGADSASERLADTASIWPVRPFFPYPEARAASPAPRSAASSTPSTML